MVGLGGFFGATIVLAGLVRGIRWLFWGRETQSTKEDGDNKEKPHLIINLQEGGGNQSLVSSGPPPLRRALSQEFEDLAAEAEAGRDSSTSRGGIVLGSMDVQVEVEGSNQRLRRSRTVSNLSAMGEEEEVDESRSDIFASSRSLATLQEESEDTYTEAGDSGLE